jgi:hypothetical protein
VNFEVKRMFTSWGGGAGVLKAPQSVRAPPDLQSIANGKGPFWALWVILKVGSQTLP